MSADQWQAVAIMLAYGAAFAAFCAVVSYSATRFWK